MLGAVSCLSSLLLLHFALDAPRAGSLFAAWGLPPLAYGQVVTLIYLKARARLAGWLEGVFGFAGFQLRGFRCAPLPACALRSPTLTPPRTALQNNNFPNPP